MLKVFEVFVMDRWNRFSSCAAALWPGLPRLWRHGSMFGLLEALTFAVLLQVAIVTTVIWPETVTLASRTVVWFGVAFFWLIFAAPKVWYTAKVMAGRPASDSAIHREDLFRRSQREYLGGEWSQAEQSLLALLGTDAGDCEARLLLASLYRHIGRWEQARDELDRLEATAGSDHWRFEILQERLALVRWKRRDQPSIATQATSVASHDAA